VRSEPTGLSWIALGVDPRVAGSAGGTVQAFRAATTMLVGQDAEIADDLTVTPLGTVEGAVPAGVVDGGKITRYTCCDRTSEAGTVAANFGQLVLVCLFGVAIRGTDPDTAVKSVITPPINALNAIVSGMPVGTPSTTLGAFLGHQAVFNVKNFGAVGNGVADDWSAIMDCWNACLAAGGGRMYFPEGEYKHLQHLDFYMPKNLISTHNAIEIVGNMYSSVLVPGPSVDYAVSLSTGLGLGNRLAMSHMMIDGSLTSGAIGLRAGQASNVEQSQDNITSYLNVAKVDIRNFGGAGAIGLYHSDVVGTTYHDVCSTSCDTACVVDAPGDGRLPTVTKFEFCRFRQSTHKGVVYKQGYRTKFEFCVYEANQEQGFYATASALKNVVGLVLNGGWFEANCADNTTTEACKIDGGTGTLQFRMDDVLFNETQKSLVLNNVVNLVLINNEFGATAGAVTATTVGGIIIWNGNNSPIGTALVHDSPTTLVVIGGNLTNHIDTFESREVLVTDTFIVGSNVAPVKLLITGAVATTALNGTGEAMKANVEGYINIDVNGAHCKIPYVRA
jgi:hypothetical protein